MAYYPKIATFYYKDRNIDIKMPIRVKLIQIKKYECKKCKENGTISQIVAYFENKHKDDLWMMKNRYVPKFGRKMIPEKLLSGDQVLCPECGQMTIPNEKEMLKFYVCAKPEYIFLEKMLDRHTLLRWDKDFHGNICCFPKELDKGVEGLNYVNSSIKFPSAKVRINRKVDMSLLKSELREYIKRKVADLL